MRITLECEQFVVFDDVLEPPELAALWAHFQSLTFQAINLGAPLSPWLPTDGRPMTGPAVAAWADPAAAIPDSKHARFPTGTPVDPLIQRLLDEAPRLGAWVGAPVEEWVVMTAVAWLYPLGSALSWHTDSTTYSGAFAFYLHPRWDPHWGGELMFAHPSARHQRELALDPDSGQPLAEHAQRFDRAALSARIAERGIGACVVPRPNRLVVLAGGHPHKIARVEPAAGDHVRASIAGFYVRSQALAALRAAAGAAATRAP